MPSARVFGESNRVFGYDLVGAEERLRADLVDTAQEWEVDARRQFEVFSLVKMGARTEEVVDTRRALTWTEAEGEKTAKARLVTKGSQGSDLWDGNAGIVSCVSCRSSHLQSISLGALKRWKVWSPDIKKCLAPDGRI